MTTSDDVIIPAFRDAPEEGKIVGRLLAGYSELEVEMLQCAHGVCGNIDVAVRALYAQRGEAIRIKATRQIIEQPYIAAGLQPKYTATMDDMDWCRQIQESVRSLSVVLHAARGLARHRTREFG